MKNKNVLLLSAFFCIAMISNSAFGQFEQKFTFQASSGLVKLNNAGGEGLDFNSGFSFDAGAQYNFNRSLSIVGLVKYVGFIEKSVPGIYDGGNLYTLGINICPKYRFFTAKKINPYILGGIGLSFISYSFPSTDEFGNPITYKQEVPTSFSYEFGAGVDISLTENFALFLQGGYNIANFNDKENGDKIPMNTIFFQIGVNINFIKAKSL